MMERENERLLKLIFPTGVPESWLKTDEFTQYLTKIGDYKVDDLTKEPDRLQEESNSLFEQTQELAYSNYKTFIQTAECSRNIVKQFNCTEKKLDSLLEKMPAFETQCERFVQTTSDISTCRRLNSLTLTRNAQLLEILELPQLMDSFIADGLYEDALELVAYVRRLGTRHPDIPIFKSIVKDVEKSWLLMLHQLLVQLKQDLQLPRCLQIVGHLRRMEVFTEAELRLKFLQARDVWLQTCLKTIPNDDATHHLTKTVELTRIHLFNIITQFRAIFNDDDHSISSSKDQYVNENHIFPSWIQEKISAFLATLEHDLQRGVTSIDSIIGQCMYFGLSFSRVGCDFRGLMVPIFTRAILSNFQRTVYEVTALLERNMEKFTLINKHHHPNFPLKSMNRTGQMPDPIQPPDSLLEFYPLAEYLNGILALFNDVRLCAPIAMGSNVATVLQSSLTTVSRAILTLYGQEQQAFNVNAKDTFLRLCLSFADDLVPYVQRCVNVLFPPNAVASHLGIGLQALQNEGIGVINRQSVLEPIKHLLPSAKTVDPDEIAHLLNVDVTVNDTDRSSSSKHRSNKDSEELRDAVVTVIEESSNDNNEGSHGQPKPHHRHHQHQHHQHHHHHHHHEHEDLLYNEPQESEKLLGDNDDDKDHRFDDAVPKSKSSHVPADDTTSTPLSLAHSHHHHDTTSNTSVVLFLSVVFRFRIYVFLVLF